MSNFLSIILQKERDVYLAKILKEKEEEIKRKEKEQREAQKNKRNEQEDLEEEERPQKNKIRFQTGYMGEEEKKQLIFSLESKNSKFPLKRNSLKKFYSGEENEVLTNRNHKSLRKFKRSTSFNNITSLQLISPKKKVFINPGFFYEEESGIFPLESDQGDEFEDLDFGRDFKQTKDKLEKKEEKKSKMADSLKKEWLKTSSSQAAPGVPEYLVTSTFIKKYNRRRRFKSRWTGASFFVEDEKDTEYEKSIFRKVSFF